MEQLLKHAWVVNAIHKAGQRGISLADLNEKWLCTDYSQGQRIPRQTFNRWKNDMEELLGVIIDCKRAAGYRYYIANPEVLSEGSLSRWLLDTYSTASTLSSKMSLKDRILVEDIPSSHDYLELLIEAMQRSKVIYLTYRGFNKEQSHSFEAEPYCVKMFQRRWYLLARSVAHDKLYIYGVDRIEGLVITSHSFKYPDDFDAHVYFSTFFGIVTDESIPIQRIVLRAYRSHKYYIRTLPLHASQRELCDNGDSADFELTLRPTYDFCMELLRVGDMIEVLEPQSLRHEMHTRLKATCSLYPDDATEVLPSNEQTAEVLPTNEQSTEVLPNNEQSTEVLPSNEQSTE